MRVRRIVTCALVWATQYGLATPGTAFEAASSPVVYVWEEEFPSDPSDGRDGSAPSSSSSRRKMISTEKQQQLPQFSSPFVPTASGPGSVLPTPHKLRTDRWELMVRWRGKHKRQQRGTMELEFSENGYVRLLSDQNTTAAIGHWELASHGLTWRLASTDAADGDKPDLVYYGDLLLNPFGPQPRIIRGVVLSETSRTWFRPLVATFTGEGVGDDTADLSYRHRKSSM